MSKDIAALELVYNNDDRFYITKNEELRYIVYDKLNNEEVYNFGSADKMVELLLSYAEINYKK